MKISRRELSVLLPTIAAAAAVGQLDAQTPAAQQTTGTIAPARAPRAKLDTRMYHHAQIPYNGNDQKKARRFFMGETHGGFNLEAHETILGAGVETHAPHKHIHEEIIIVLEGTVET